MVVPRGTTPLCNKWALVARDVVVEVRSSRSGGGAGGQSVTGL
jgi:hypothetical protein